MSKAVFPSVDLGRVGVQREVHLLGGPKESLTPPRPDRVKVGGSGVSRRREEEGKHRWVPDA